MTELQAHAVYSVLVETAGASERSRDSFVYSQTREFVSEWRFMGDLGFGGKFWRNTGFLPDGSWGEKWYVNYYAEHETAERRATMEAANARLEPICAAACS